MIGTSALALLLLLGRSAAPHRVPNPMPDSALVAAARANVDAIRDSLRRTLIETASDSQPAAGLAIARHLAEALAAAWNDSFPMRQVKRFEAWPIADRRIKASADSLRAAGNRTASRWRCMIGARVIGAAHRSAILPAWAPRSGTSAPDSTNPTSWIARTII